MKLLLIFSAIFVLAASAFADIQEAQGQFCEMCNKNWEEKVPKSWAEMTGYMVSWKQKLMKSSNLARDFDLGGVFSTNFLSGGSTG